MARRTADLFSQFEHIRERMEQAYQRLLGGPGSPGFFHQPGLPRIIDDIENSHARLKYAGR